MAWGHAFRGLKPTATLASSLRDVDSLTISVNWITFIAKVHRYSPKTAGPVILTGMSDAADRRLRWYHLTPDRFVIGLLAVDGLLGLSGRFQCFEKGWPVLIALATLAMAALFLLAWFAVALVTGWRFQFSIRSLLVLTLAVAAPFSWLAVERKAAREQKDAVEEMRRLGWDVSYDWYNPFALKPQPPQPAWLRNLLGEDFFARVIYCRNGKITDAGRADLEGFSKLERLWLSGTGITDAVLEHLEGLTQLRYLRLSSTRVTGAGLANFKGLTKLRRLELRGTNITDAGLEHLKHLKQLQELWLDGTQDTDAGLRHLEGLKQLRELRLDTAHVTDEGMMMLSRALPNCEVTCYGATIGRVRRY
jgi:hypothetical protein